MFSVTRVLGMTKSHITNSMKLSLQALSTRTHFLITAKMRSVLLEELMYNLEDVRGMSPNFAAEIIRKGRKREPEITDEDIESWIEHFKEFDRLPGEEEDAELHPTLEEERGNVSSALAIVIDCTPVNLDISSDTVSGIKEVPTETIDNSSVKP